MNMNRRTFAKQPLASGALGVMSASLAVADEQFAPIQLHGNRIAVSTYSSWRFKDDLKLSIERCIDEAARMGFDGIEFLLYQMEIEEPGYLQRLNHGPPSTG